MRPAPTRRDILKGAALLSLSACVEGAVFPDTATERDWRPHFADLDRAAILVDTDMRRLSFWGAGNLSYREYPIGVPRLPELTRTGRTRVVRRKAGPSWAAAIVAQSDSAPNAPEKRRCMMIPIL